MANKMKRMKQKMNNGDLEDIVIGADAENVDVSIDEDIINLQEYISSLETKLKDISNATIEWNKGLDLTE
jgi:hypothetical protein